MPGQLEMLAGDLAAGGFGTQATNYRAMDKVYDPMQVPTFNQPLKTTHGAPKATGGAAITDPNQMILIDGKWKPAWMTSHIQTTGRPKGR